MSKAIPKERSGWYRAFAPATIANFGSGFDTFAAALRAVGPLDEPAQAGKAGHGRRNRGTPERAPLGDHVSVKRRKDRGVRVVAITGDGGRLPTSRTRNTAAVAAEAVLRAARVTFGLDLVLDKGLPLSSGLGSSAASAAAGAYAAALALESEIDKNDLVAPALAGEHVADGSWHGDNVWASLIGGGLIVVSTRPPEIVPVGSAPSFRWVAVHPEFELSTRRARAVLPEKVALADATAQVGRFAALVDAWKRGDRKGIGRALEDRLAEPYRAPLVPGYEQVRKAALRAGAHGISLAGAGPSVVAVTPEGQEETVGRAMRRAFARAGLDSSMMVCAVDARGARRA